MRRQLGPTLARQTAMGVEVKAPWGSTEETEIRMSHRQTAFNRELSSIQAYDLPHSLYSGLCSVPSVLSDSVQYTDCSPPGSSVHAILQARILGWVAIPFSRGSSRPRDGTHISCVFCMEGKFFTAEAPGKPHSLSYGSAKRRVSTYFRSLLFF